MRARTAIAPLLIAGALASAMACGGGDAEDAPPTPASTPLPNSAPSASPTLPGAQPPSSGEAIGCALPIADQGQGQRPLQEDLDCEGLPEGYQVEEYVRGLRRPVAMAFAPDGRMFVTEQHSGDIRVVVDGELLPLPFASVERLHTSHEAGLLGIAVHPDFERNHYVYVLYNAKDLFPTQTVTKVVRYTEVDNMGTDRVEIYGSLPGPVDDIHTGGNLHFGLDGKLYIALGDFFDQNNARNLETVGGKILRVNPDGSAPEDNPLYGQSDVDPRVYAYGMRNPFDFDFHPATGTIFAVDNGPEEDEINRVEPGGYHGWPDGVGPVDEEGAVDPIIHYEFPAGPAGTSFYSGERLGEFTNDFFFCQFHSGGLLHRVQLGEVDRTVESDSVISGGCTSDVAEGPDGLLYFIDLFNGVIYRITN